MTLREYHRLRLKAIAEGRHFDDDDIKDHENKDRELTHVEEQTKLKEDIKVKVYVQTRRAP